MNIKDKILINKIKNGEINCKTIGSLSHQELKPSIWKQLVEAKITDIMIITGTEHMGDMISLLGSGTEYGCSFTFRVQDRPDETQNTDLRERRYGAPGAPE